MKPFVFKQSEACTAGVVTLLQYMAMPDGSQYQYLWADRWEVLPDKAMPIEDFRSHEKWTLAGVVDGQAVVLIPGCQVKCWAFCRTYLARSFCYNVSTGKACDHI